MNWFIKRKLEKEQKKQLMKTPHICNDCKGYENPVRRVSVLILLIFIAVSLLIGFFTSLFATTDISILVGFLSVVLLTFIEAKRTKPTCALCFSENIRLPKDESEYLKITKNINKKDNKLT